MKVSCELTELNVQATVYLSCEVWCKQIFTWCLSIWAYDLWPYKGIIAKATNHNSWSIIQTLYLYKMFYNHDLQISSSFLVSHSQTSYNPIWKFTILLITDPFHSIIWFWFEFDLGCLTQLDLIVTCPETAFWTSWLLNLDNWILDLESFNFNFNFTFLLEMWSSPGLFNGFIL